METNEKVYQAYSTPFSVHVNGETSFYPNIPQSFALAKANGGGYNSAMKTCLGSLLLVPVILALVLTVVYHTSVNQEVRFEQRDTNAQYINTARSYRPPEIKEQPKAAAEATHPATEQLRDDDAAEEVDE